MTLRIGITGGIGSGKTTIARIFETLRIPVYYADDAAKKMMNEDDSLKEQIVKHFGIQAYNEGRLNREYLSALVFRDKQQLAILNAIVHPATIRNSNQWMKDQTGPYALREAALIFESGVQGQLDYVIGVSAPTELRIRRAMERDGISREKVLERMARQINESIKMKLCDFIIVNDERQPVIPQVLKLHRQLIAISSTLP